MNPTFDHKYISSFKEYLDHKIVKELGAYKQKTLSLLPVENDDRMSQYKVYSCGDRQFAYDSSAITSYVAPVVKEGINIITPNHIDYRNSRVICNLPSNITNGTIEVYQKLFNTYVTSMSDESILLKMETNSSKERLAQSIVKGDSYLAPCLFIKSFYSENEGFELGGVDKTKIILKVSCFVNSEFEMIALQGAMRDLNATSAYLLNNTPLNEFNDLKTSWDYIAESAAAKAAGNPRIEIESVRFSPTNSDNIDSKFANTYIGVATFDTWLIRNPRA